MIIVNCQAIREVGIALSSLFFRGIRMIISLQYSCSLSVEKNKRVRSEMRDAFPARNVFRVAGGFFVTY